MSIKTLDSKRIRTKKKILSVTIRRMVDNSPDTSHLGEYSSHSTSQFSIDRAHAEDCESLKPGIDLAEEWSKWTGSAREALERVRVFLEEYQAETEHDSSPNGCAEGCAACEEEQFYTDAVETVWELEKSAGECDCHGGDMGRNELRYFNPSFNYVTKTDDPADGLTPEEVRKYVREDYARMERMNRGDWCYIGIRAEAEVVANVQSEGKPGKWHGVVQRVTSGGLWGIESDSKRSYIEEEQAGQLAELKTELLAMGFSKRAISIAFKNVEEKDE